MKNTKLSEQIISQILVQYQNGVGTETIAATMGISPYETYVRLFDGGENTK